MDNTCTHARTTILLPKQQMSDGIILEGAWKARDRSISSINNARADLSGEGSMVDTSGERVSYYERKDTGRESVVAVVVPCHDF